MADFMMADRIDRLAPTTAAQVTAAAAYVTRVAEREGWDDLADVLAMLELDGAG